VIDHLEIATETEGGQSTEDARNIRQSQYLQSTLSVISTGDIGHGMAIVIVITHACCTGGVRSLALA